MSVGLVRADTGETIALPGAQTASVERRGEFTSYATPDGRIGRDHYRDDGAVVSISLTIDAEGYTDLVSTLEEIRGKTALSLARTGKALIENLGLSGYTDLTEGSDLTPITLDLVEVLKGSTLTISREVRPTPALSSAMAPKEPKGPRGKTRIDESGSDTAVGKAVYNTGANLFGGGS